MNDFSESTILCQNMQLLNRNNLQIISQFSGDVVSNNQRNVLMKQRNWERQLAAKKSKRKEEKQRRKLNRGQESGDDQQSQAVVL